MSLHCGNLHPHNPHIYEVKEMVGDGQCLGTPTKPGHPNLSDEINQSIANSERDGGIFTKDVPPGSTVLVQTRNTLYTLVNHGDRWLGKGGKNLPEMKVIHVNGSTFGGSMIKIGFIGIGMHLELCVQRHGESFEPLLVDAANGPYARVGHTMLTTPIQSIEVSLPDTSGEEN